MPSPAVTLTGTLRGVDGSNSAGSLKITLVNYGVNPPIVSGAEIAAVSTVVQAAADGTWSTALWGNDQVSPLNTYYTVEVYSPAGNPTWQAAYLLNSGSYDLGNLTPLVVSTPAAFPFIQGMAAQTAPAHNFLTGVNSAGVFSYTRPWATPVIADQSVSLQSAISEVVGLGGGTVVIPPNTTLTLTGTGAGEWSLLNVGNNVTILGMDQQTSIIKVGNGVIGSGTDYPNIIYYSNGTTPLQNFSIRNLTVDFNGANNLVPASTPGKRMALLYAPYANDILIQDCIFKNNPGSQTLAFGSNTAPQTAQRINVKGCRFHNFGPGVTGNTFCTDHSAVYIQADDSEVSGSYFYNDSLPTNGTGIELHCRDSRIFGNEVKNCVQGMNLVATVTDFTNNTIVGNTMKSVVYGFRVYVQNSKTFKDVRVTCNSISLANSSGSLGGLVTNTTDCTSAPVGLAFTGNTVTQEGTLTGTSQIAAGCYLVYGDNLVIQNNDFHNLSGRGVDVYANIDRIRVSENNIWDVGQGGHAGPFTQGISIQTAGTINRATIANNNIYNENAANYITEGIKLSGAVNAIGDLGSNKIASNIATRLQLSGWTGTLTWAAYADQQDGHYYVKDLTNSAIRLDIAPNNATNIMSGSGATVITLNTASGSGTGGIAVGNGAGAATCLISGAGLGTFNGGVKAASTGTTLKQIKLFTALAVDPGSIATVSRGSIAVTVPGTPGIAAGDVIIPVQGVNGINDDLVFEGVTATGTDQVTFFFYNPTGGAIDDTSHNWDILWIDVT